MLFLWRHREWMEWTIVTATRRAIGTEKLQSERHYSIYVAVWGASSTAMLLSWLQKGCLTIFQVH